MENTYLVSNIARVTLSWTSVSLCDDRVLFILAHMVCLRLKKTPVLGNLNHLFKIKSEFFKASAYCQFTHG